MKGIPWYVYVLGAGGIGLGLYLLLKPKKRLPDVIEKMLASQDTRPMSDGEAARLTERTADAIKNVVIPEQRFVGLITARVIDAAVAKIAPELWSVMVGKKKPTGTIDVVLDIPYDNEVADLFRSRPGAKFGIYGGLIIQDLWGKFPEIFFYARRYKPGGPESVYDFRFQSDKTEPIIGMMYDETRLYVIRDRDTGKFRVIFNYPYNVSTYEIYDMDTKLGLKGSIMIYSFLTSAYRPTEDIIEKYDRNYAELYRKTSK